MSKSLTYGMVGGGPGSFIGEAHIRAIALDRVATIASGVFSRDPEKSKITARALDLAEDRVYLDYRAMAKAEAAREDGIDFVVVVTPNVSHYEISKAFLEAGIHVVCDKPFTTTLEEAKELHQLASEKGLLLFVTYPYASHITARQAREMIKAGDIGEIRMVHAEYIQGWLASDDLEGNIQAEWRLDPARSGRSNTLADIGSHVENTVYQMTGLHVTEVLAKMEIKVPNRKLDDNSTALVNFDNGATGMYWVSQVAIGHDNGLQVRIYGDKGSILWKQEESEKLHYAKQNGIFCEIHRGQASIHPNVATYNRLPAGHPEGWFEAMANVYRDFTNAVRAKADGTFTDEMVKYPSSLDGLRGMAFIEACLESSEKGNVWVKVPQFAS